MNAYMLNSNSGANMAQIIELAKKLDIDIMSLTAEEVEELEDRRTANRIMEGLASGLADRDEMLRELGLR